MANVYLEKIASLAAVGRAVGKGVKAVGRAATNQVYLSTGGAFVDHAAKLGVKDPYKLAGATDVQKLWKMSRGTLGKNPTRADVHAHFKQFKNQTLPELKKTQRNARIRVGATTAAVGYGAYKAKEKMNEPKVNSYEY